MTFMTHQKGLSPLGVLAVVCLFALITVSALKMIPSYLQYSAIKTVYENINHNPNIDNMSPSDVYSAISKSLSINSVEDFDIKDSTIISSETGHMKVGLDYEVRKPLFANVDIVMKFHYLPK